MSADDVKTVVSVLQTGGPWTLVLGLAYVVKYLYQAREQDRIRHDEEKQKLNDRIISMAEKQNDLLDRADLNQKLLIEAIRK